MDSAGEWRSNSLNRVGFLFEIKGLGAYSQAAPHMHCSIGQCVCRGTCLEAVFLKKFEKGG